MISMFPSGVFALGCRVGVGAGEVWIAGRHRVVTYRGRVTSEIIAAGIPRWRRVAWKDDIDRGTGVRYGILGQKMEAVRSVQR